MMLRGRKGATYRLNDRWCSQRGSCIYVRALERPGTSWRIDRYGIIDIAWRSSSNEKPPLQETIEELRTSSIYILVFRAQGGTDNQATLAATASWVVGPTLNIQFAIPTMLQNNYHNRRTQRKMSGYRTTRDAI